MENSRVNLASLLLALVAGLVAFHAGPQAPVTSLVGLTVLIALFAYGPEGARSGMQSFAFALVCGLAFLCAFSFPLNFLVPLITGKSPFLEGPYFPALLWLIGTVIFVLIDRSGSGSPQAVTLSSSYAAPSQTFQPAPAPPTPAPRPQPEIRTFTPAPVTVSTPAPEPPAPVSVPEPQPVYAAAPAPAPAPAAAPAAAAPAPPVLSGKEVQIYVTMLGEGMNVLRSVRAEHLGRDFYIITDEMPADENWEYVPGQVVRCKKKNLSNGKGLVAYEEAPRAQQA